MPTYEIEGKKVKTEKPLTDVEIEEIASSIKSTARGAAMPTAARGALTFAQGPTLGFADELAGATALGALGQSYAMGGTDTPPSRADYTGPRDVVRGATRSFAEQYPIGSTALQMLGGAALGGVGAARSAALTVPQRLGQALKTGAVTGGATGAGESEAETLGGIGLDALTGAGASASRSPSARAVPAKVSEPTKAATPLQPRGRRLRRR